MIINNTSISLVIRFSNSWKQHFDGGYVGYTRMTLGQKRLDLDSYGEIETDDDKEVEILLGKADRVVGDEVFYQLEEEDLWSDSLDIDTFIKLDRDYIEEMYFSLEDDNRSKVIQVI